MSNHAAIAEALAPLYRRREEKKRTDAKVERRRLGLATLRKYFSWQATEQDKVRAEKTFEARFREDPDADPCDLAREVGLEAEGAVKQRVQATEDADRARRAASDRAHQARMLLISDTPYGATSEEKEEMEGLLDQRLRENPGKTAREVVTAVLKPLIETVEKRRRETREAEEKAVKAQLEAIDLRRKKLEAETERADWVRTAKSRLQDLWRTAVEEEQADLNKEEKKHGSLDPAQDAFNTNLTNNYSVPYQGQEQFVKKLEKLKVGADVDEAAGKSIASTLDGFWTAAEREADEKNA